MKRLERLEDQMKRVMTILEKLQRLAARRDEPRPSRGAAVCHAASSPRLRQKTVAFRARAQALAGGLRAPAAGAHHGAPGPGDEEYMTHSYTIRSVKQ